MSGADGIGAIALITPGYKVASRAEVQHGDETPVSRVYGLVIAVEDAVDPTTGEKLGRAFRVLQTDDYHRPLHRCEHLLLEADVDPHKLEPVYSAHIMSALRRVGDRDLAKFWKRGGGLMDSDESAALDLIAQLHALARSMGGAP